MTLAWWRLRRFRHRSSEADPTLVPEAVIRLAEERWSACVPGSGVLRETTSPAIPMPRWNRTSDAAARKQAGPSNGGAGTTAGEEDPRLVEDGTDPWLNGLDEFASVVGIYLRYVIKAGAKDGIDHRKPSKETRTATTSGRDW